MSANLKAAIVEASAVLLASRTSSFSDIALVIALSTASNLSISFSLKLPKKLLIDVIGSLATSINLAPQDFAGGLTGPPVLSIASTISPSTPSVVGADHKGISVGALADKSLLKFNALSIATSEAFKL